MGPGAAGLLLVADLLLVTFLALVALLLLFRVVDRALRVHPLLPGRAVIGAALGAEALTGIIGLAAGLAADGRHRRSSLLCVWIYYTADQADCLSALGCGEKKVGNLKLHRADAPTPSGWAPAYSTKPYLILMRSSFSSMGSASTSRKKTVAAAWTQSMGKPVT